MKRSKSLPAVNLEQVQAGIDRCLKTAWNLYHAGVVAHFQDIPGPSRALLVLALEEYGKVGWLYWSVTLSTEDRGRWERFWAGFYSHRDKNSVGRRMLGHATTTDLLPTIVHFFEYESPFFSVSPREIDVYKQGMLNVDFNPAAGMFVAPEEHLANSRIDTSSLRDSIELLIQYVARNKKKGVFDLENIARFKEIHSAAKTNADLAGLLRSFQNDLLTRKPD